jgi:hypothetical protein
MSQPIVIGYHLTWTAYGFWLPNDPRDSMSHCIACDVLAELGELHYGRKQVQPAGRVIREFRQRAADILKFPILPFGIPELDIIRRTIRYIENNPVKWKLPRQEWPFVKPYDGWPLHPGAFCQLALCETVARSRETLDTAAKPQAACGEGTITCPFTIRFTPEIRSTPAMGLPGSIACRGWKMPD